MEDKGRVKMWRITIDDLAREKLSLELNNAIGEVYLEITDSLPRYSSVWLSTLEMKYGDDNKYFHYPCTILYFRRRNRK